MPENVGLGNFGGVVGIMPAQEGTAPTMGAMPPAPAPPAAVVGSAPSAAAGVAPPAV